MSASVQIHQTNDDARTPIRRRSNREGHHNYSIWASASNDLGEERMLRNLAFLWNHERRDFLDEY